MSRWSVAAAVVLAVAVLAVGAATAQAGTYTVASCTNGSLSGWSHFNFGPWSTWGQSCGHAGGAMVATIGPAGGSTAGWTFSAPADTEIAGFALTRSYSLPANRPYGTGVYLLSTSGPGAGYYGGHFNWDGAYAAGPGVESTSGLRGQTALTARIDCGGGADCTGTAALHVLHARIDLRDDHAPSLGAVSGSLLAAGPLRGVRALSYSASDRGGGVAREQLLVDGALLADRRLDCSDALAVPCPLAVSGTVALDTARLPDGAHDVELVVWDATLANLVRHGPVTIAVDNVPPPASTSAPRVYGTPRVGETLYADDGAWTGTDLSFVRRWQRFEDGAWEDVAGAWISGYVPTPEDAGHRLRFRVRATNAEGTTEARSEPTAQVAVAPAATPTPTPTPTPAPVANAAPGPVTAPLASVAEPPLLAFPTAAFRATGRSTITVRWGERRRVSGTLLRPDGRPVAGARVTVTSRLRALDAHPIPHGDVVTDASGRFAYTVGSGPSRTITFGYRDATALRTASVTVRVIPRVTVRISRGGTIQGRVTGAPAGVRKVIELQAPRGRTWRTFASIRLAPTRGTFTHRPRRPPRRVRALARADPGWPFLTAHSPPATRPR